MNDKNKETQNEMERTKPEPDRKSEGLAEEHRSEGTLRRGLTPEQQRDELRGGSANRRDLRDDAERQNEDLKK